MIKKVYVVTSGEYSDFGIEQVFSTKEKAQNFIDLSKEYGNDSINDEIDEYDLDPDFGVPHYHKFKYFYFVEMDKEGNIKHCNKTHLDIMNPEVEKEMLYLTKDYLNKKSVLNAIINANDKEHAIKIMGEKRTKILAANRWIDDIGNRYSIEL